MPSRPFRRTTSGGPDGPVTDSDTGDVYVLDRRGSREVDRVAVERYAMPSILLMENAARLLADVALEMVEDVGVPGVLVVCGPGNNGGDGLSAARHLHNAGARVAILSTIDLSKFTGDAGVNGAIVAKMGLAHRAIDSRNVAGSADLAAGDLGRVDLIVDAIFGTGLDRPVTGAVASLIEWINARRKTGVAVVAADLPSGIDADTGEPLGVAVVADVTVTFAGLKKGFTSLAAQEYLGDVVVADIGVPRELIEAVGVRLPRHADARPTVALRAHDSRRASRRGK